TSGSAAGAVLADGTYNVTATAMDIAGTTSEASTTLSAVIDTKAPPAPVVTGTSTVTANSGAGGPAVAQNLIISGTAQAGTTVAVMLNGTVFAHTMAGTNGAWSYSPGSTLPNGS